MIQKAKERSMIIITRQEKINDVENKRGPDLILYIEIHCELNQDTV